MSARQERYRCCVAVLLALGLAVVYITLIVRIDNTNLGTTNGLWKAPAVRAWELGTGALGDSGSLFYIPTYGLLSRWIPDSFVSYGVHGKLVIFRKMAFFNALFGALASGVVFLLALRFIPSMSGAFVVFLAHASAGFVVLNSLNSEDVIPAYAFFMLTTALWFEYVVRRKAYLLVASAFFLTLTTLFHWTLMIPGLAALGATQLFMVRIKKHRAWLLIVFPLLFVGMIEVVEVFLHFQNPSFWHLSPLQILYPAKASPTGWVGFEWNKLLYAIIGVGNYFSGAYNCGDYRMLLRFPAMLKTMSISWLFLGLTLAACLWAVFNKHTHDHIRLLGGYGLALFSIGELEHLYSQPQDPQSQIQPMFVGVIGLIIILHHFHSRLTNVRLRALHSALAIALLFNGFWNIRLMYASRGYDSESVRAARELAELFPPSNTIVVSHGFEGWNTWRHVEVYGGNSSEYLSKNIHLCAAFTNHPGISAQAAADLVRRQIGDAFEAGYRVVAAALWTQPRDDFIVSLTTVVDNQKATIFDDSLRNAFRLGRSWATPVGRFVELRPLAPSR